MKIEIKYSTGERHMANIPEEAIKESIPCMFDSLHTSCGKMTEDEYANNVGWMQGDPEPEDDWKPTEEFSLPLGDCLQRGKVIDTVNRMYRAMDGENDIETFRQLLTESFKVMPAEKKKDQKGHWINRSSYGMIFIQRWECSECGEKLEYQRTKYCPNCGSEMELERRNDG